MAILTQILLILVVCAVAYAVYETHFSKPKGPSHAPHEHPRKDAQGHEDHAEGHHAEHVPAPAAAVSHSRVPDRALSASVKIVVYVPDAHAEEIRRAIGQAGGGVIGNYTFCSFSSLGTGRYLPGSGANPMVGTVGVHESVEEERIEFTCSRENLRKVVSTIKKVHPYEEIVIDIYPLEAHPEPEDVPAPADSFHHH